MCNSTSVLGARPSVRRSAIEVGISISICTKPSILALLHVEISSLKPDCFRNGCYIAALLGSLGGLGKGVRTGRKALWRWSWWKIHLQKGNVCWELMLVGGHHLFLFCGRRSLEVSGIYSVQTGPTGYRLVGRGGDEALKSAWWMKCNYT